MAQNDLILRTVFDWIIFLRLVLEAQGVPPWVTDLLAGVLTVAGLVAMVGLLGTLADRLEQRLRGRAGSVWGLAAGAAAAGAAVLLWWLIRHPGEDLLATSVRWDFLAMAGLLGCAFAGVPIRARSVALVALSLLVLPAYCGRLPLAIMLAGCLLGWAALLPAAGRRGWLPFGVQGALMVGVVAVFWMMRDGDPARALRGWGFFSFIGFRHLSFAHEACRGNASRRLDDYLLHLLILPGCQGAMETYAEFHQANLTERPGPRARTAMSWAALGGLQATIALRIPIDQAAMLASASTTAMWGNLLLLFLRSSLFVMGIWGTLEAGALLLGIRLRRNFSGVLSATDPSLFWRAWRGTMTNWLIRHVYIPLGGNRAHQIANILAVFVVSTAWHCLGIPFLRPQTWRWWDLAPVLLWGALNFVGVAVHGVWRRRWPARARSGWSGLAVRGAKTGLTWCFGSMTVSLLGFSVADVELFERFVRVLAGFPAPLPGP